MIILTSDWKLSDLLPVPCSVLTEQTDARMSLLQFRMLYFLNRHKTLDANFVLWPTNAQLFHKLSHSVRWYGASSFAGSIWLIPFFSTYAVSFSPLKVGYKATRVFDSGCMEYFGGQGLYWVLFNFDRVNQWFQCNNLKVFLGFFIMWIVIFS